MIFRSKYSDKYELEQMQTTVDLRLQRIYELDQCLFMQIELPKFPRYNLSKVQMKILQQERMSLKLAEWNSFERITGFLQPSIQTAERIVRSEEITSLRPRYLVINLPIEGTAHSYNVRFHSKKNHNMQAVPQTVEIFQRLVLRGVLTDDLSDLLN